MEAGRIQRWRLANLREANCSRWCARAACPTRWCDERSSCCCPRPHRARSLKLSTDPFFVEKVRDIVGLYFNPPDKALVLCVDEKSTIQVLERTPPMLPMGLG